jgi:ketosteroid isomerase-like protein
VRGVARQFFETFNIEFEQTVDEVEVYGDWGFARWHYAARYIPKAPGDVIPENGKEIWIFKRQADNSWKCSFVIWNSNDPPPTSQENQ